MRTRTSRIGNSGRRLRERGFSLIEVVAAVAIMAIAAATVGSFVGGRADGLSLQALAGRTASAVRSARDRAIRTRRDSAVAVDLMRRQVRTAAAGQPIAIDEQIDVDVAVASQEHRVRGVRQGAVQDPAENTATIRFFPNGMSTGGTIRYGHRGTAYEVRVNWFTGRVAVVRVS